MYLIRLCTLKPILPTIAYKEIENFVQFTLALRQGNCKRMGTRLLCRKSPNYSELFNRRIERVSQEWAEIFILDSTFRSDTHTLVYTDVRIRLKLQLLIFHYSLCIYDFVIQDIVKFTSQLTFFMHIINLVENEATSRIATERNKNQLTIVLKVLTPRVHKLEVQCSFHSRVCTKPLVGSTDTQ